MPGLFLLDVENEVSETGQLKLSRVPNGTPETVFRSFSAGLDVCKVGKIPFSGSANAEPDFRLDVCKVGKIHAGVKNLTPATVMVLRNKTHAESGASNEAPEAETRSYAIRPMQNQV